jgi:hypothetical protein
MCHCGAANLKTPFIMRCSACRGVRKVAHPGEDEVCIAAAVARGARPCNPRMRARDPLAITLMKASLADTTLERTRATAKGWIDAVRRYRPHLAWGDVVRTINRDRDKAGRGPLTTLKAQVARLVKAGDLPRRDGAPRLRSARSQRQRSNSSRTRCPTPRCASLRENSMSAAITHPEARVGRLSWGEVLLQV